LILKTDNRQLKTFPCSSRHNLVTVATFLAAADARHYASRGVGG
jgi:hypothetical protein